MRPFVNTNNYVFRQRIYGKTMTGWILDTGFWNDDKIWIDTELWKDS